MKRKAMKKGQLVDLKKMNSVLFLRLGKIGDMMLSSWILKRVRRAYPHLKIGLLTLPRSKPLFRYNKDIDHIKIWRPLTLPLTALTERLRGWDLMVDLNDEASRRSLLALRLINPKHSMAFRNHKSLGKYEFTVKPLPKEKSHVIERLAVVSHALGIPAAKAELKPEISLKAGSFDKIKHEQQWIIGSKGIVVSLNISAGHPSRYWAPDKWIELAGKIMSVSPRVWLRFLYSPADKRLAAHIIAALEERRVLPPVGRALNDFLAAIAASDTLISPDTSAVHAACAFGVPVLGLYPEPYWNFVSFRPLGRNCNALRSPGGGVDNIKEAAAVKAAIKMVKTALKSR